MKKQEVFEFLSKRGVSSDIHEKCYRLTGGRINHLKLFVSEMVGNRLAFEGNALS